MHHEVEDVVAVVLLAVMVMIMGLVVVVTALRHMLVALASSCRRRELKPVD